MIPSLTQVLDRLTLVAFSFAAGLALGFLLAPDAGSRTRKRIADGARERAREAQSQARGVTEPVVERLRGASHELAKRHVPLADDWDIVDGKDLLDGLTRHSRR